MKAYKVFEKFREQSDPIKDMGIGLKYEIKEAFKNIYKYATFKLMIVDYKTTLEILYYLKEINKDIEIFKKILKPFCKEIYIQDRNVIRAYIIAVIKPEYKDIFKETYREFVKETF